jgi:subtilisin family serine protease
VRRSLLPVVLLALALTGTAAARVAADPLQPQEWWLSRIGADRATQAGPGVPVAIVDSGTDPTHEEFAGRPNSSFLNDQTWLGREEYHGTAVASVAAAPENGLGMQGVYPQAVLQVWDASPTSFGITDSNAVAGISAIALHCPAVINLSFGSPQQDPGLENAVLNAFRNGCLVVAASGNGGQAGSPVAYPAGWAHVLTVGATDANDAVAAFSTTGPALDVVAPGVEILGATPLARNPAGYSTFSGTSFSSPIVAAAAAWIWTLRPTLTVTQLTQLLRNSARDLGAPGYDLESGYGMLDIPAALAAPTPPNDPFEPNEDVDHVKPGRLFETGEPALTSAVKQSTRVAATLASVDDPRDVYRIWVPAKRYVHVAATGAGVSARIWGPQTVSVEEGSKARRRDLRGTKMYGGAKGSTAYVEVQLTGGNSTASYVLSVKAAKK